MTAVLSPECVFSLAYLPEPNSGGGVNDSDSANDSPALLQKSNASFPVNSL